LSGRPANGEAEPAEPPVTAALLFSESLMSLSFYWFA